MQFLYSASDTPDILMAFKKFYRSFNKTLLHQCIYETQR